MSKDNNSVNHHYIPQCYIKNFINKDGKVFVFDKPNIDFYLQRGKSAFDLIKEKYPSQICFISNDNTIFDSDGNRNDYIEQLYGKIDEMFSRFPKILKYNGSNFPLEQHSRQWFYYSILSLFYRVPSIRELIRGIKKIDPAGFAKFDQVHLPYTLFKQNFFKTG